MILHNPDAKSKTMHPHCYKMCLNNLFNPYLAKIFCLENVVC